MKNERTSQSRWPRIRKLSLGVAVLAAFFFKLGPDTAFAQFNSVGRGPSINIGPRIEPHIDISPNLHYSPNIYGGPAQVDGGGPPLRQRSVSKPPASGGSSASSAGLSGAGNNLFVAHELVIALSGNPTDAQADALARRFRLRRTESRHFPLIGATLLRLTILDNRPPITVARQVASASGVLSAQPNYRYTLQQDAPGGAASGGDPAQYVLSKLHLNEAHALALGRGVLIAVIDSGIDPDQPEFAGSIASSFDALDSKEGPHPHGTGVAGAIVAHSRLMSSAPQAKLLAIRAFGATSTSAESTSFVILKSLDYAVANGAQIINMSFAGPQDPLLTRGLAAAASHHVVLIAAAGNAGPKSPPLYPAADPNVIAVSATDASDSIFPASNRGAQIALAAPGVDLLLPSVNGKYQVSSGTSFSAAYVSGIAALLLERNTGLTPPEVRAALVQSAHDLGPKGRDDDFGAGLADAQAAISTIEGPQAAAASSSAAR